MPRHPITISAIQVGAFLFVTLWSAGARADLLGGRDDDATVFMPVGILGSVSNRAVGIGAELTLDTDLNEGGWGLGLLAQYERLSDGANRLTGGGQLLLYFMGVELGLMRCSTSATASTALHVAPFVSYFGILSAALRFDVLLSHSGPEPPAVEVGLAATLKFPVPLNGRFPLWR